MKRIILLLTAISVIAFQSCKKDEFTNPDNLSKTSSLKTESSKFNPNDISDMNEYLSGFINDMKSATKGDGTLLQLEEAEWHLTSCLNYQFCNANTGRIDMLYDTIISKIHIDNNGVMLTDLSKSFQEISTIVTSIYNSYNITDKQIVYIYSTIDTHNEAKDGESLITTVMATTSRNSHYYFSNWNYDLLENIFPGEVHYNWIDAAEELEDYIAYFAVRPETENFYYVNLRNKFYNYEDYPIYDNSSNYAYRLYKCGACYALDDDHLCGNDMKFYLDSYLGLLSDECQLNEMLVNAIVRPNSVGRDHVTNLLYHNLYGIIGTPVVNNNNDLYN